MSLSPSCATFNAKHTVIFPAIRITYKNGVKEQPINTTCNLLSFLMFTCNYINHVNSYLHDYSMQPLHNILIFMWHKLTSDILFTIVKYWCNLFHFIVDNVKCRNKCCLSHNVSYISILLGQQQLPLYHKYLLIAFAKNAHVVLSFHVTVCVLILWIPHIFIIII